MNKQTQPRLVTPVLSERLRVMPAVVVTGARQTGKSTLARELLPQKRQYRTLDDLDVLDTARRDPTALIGGPTPLTIDEIQREPRLLAAIKRAIDEDRRPGQFLLTGSANLLLMRRVSETLAGRASYLTLWPLTRRERLGEGRCGIWEALIEARDTDWLDILASSAVEPEDWPDAIENGGYPTPALHLATGHDRRVWREGYVRTYLERDLQDLSAVASLPDFRRLMRGACLRLGQLVNQTELGRDLGIPQPTVHRYLNLLEASYQLVRLPAYAVNRTKRLVKSPRYYWSDTALALFLAELEQPTESHLANFVLTDLLAWRDARLDRAEIYYWRTTIGEEVDLVLETAGTLLPIEIKATPRPRLAHVAHLRAFRQEYEGQARCGLLLHTGQQLEWLAPDVLAVPWWHVL